MPKKGEKASLETRKRLSDAMKGKKLPEAVREKLRDSWWKRNTPEVRARRAESIRRAYKNPDVLQRVSEGTRSGLARCPLEVLERRNKTMSLLTTKQMAALSKEERVRRMDVARAGWRRRDTKIEKMAQALLLKQGIQFVAQFKVGRYRADLCIPAAKIIIECDGTYWHSSDQSMDRDEYRDKVMLESGFTVIRLPEKSFKTGAAQFLLSIIARLAKLENQ